MVANAANQEEDHESSIRLEDEGFLPRKGMKSHTLFTLFVQKDNNSDRQKGVNSIFEFFSEVCRDSHSRQRKRERHSYPLSTDCESEISLNKRNM